MTLQHPSESGADSAGNGLRAAFMALRPALLRFMMARGASSEDAADLVQDLYLKLDQAGSTPVAEPRAYLYRMADNLVLDQRRSAQRRARRNEAWVGPDPDRDDRPSTEAVLIARERLGHIERALRALPERTADIFRRFRLDGQSQRTIAAALDISLSAVEKHLQRAYRAVLAAKTEIDADLPPPRRHTDTNGIFDV